MLFVSYTVYTHVFLQSRSPYIKTTDPCHQQKKMEIAVAKFLIQNVLPYVTVDSPSFMELIALSFIALNFSHFNADFSHMQFSASHQNDWRKTHIMHSSSHCDPNVTLFYHFGRLDINANRIIYGSNVPFHWYKVAIAVNCTCMRKSKR